LSAISLQSHCTEITDICSQIANEVSEKVRPWFECKTSDCAFPAPAVSRLNPREQLPENRFHVASGPLNSVRDLSTNTPRNPRFECSIPNARTKIRDLSAA
jgi:hypothetical protein